MQDYSGYGQPPDYGSTAPMPPMPPRPPRRRVGLLSYLAVAIAAAALGAGTVVAVYHPASSSSVAAQPSGAASANPLPSNAVPQPSNGGSGAKLGTQQILSKVEPGLVIVNTTLQYSSEEAAGTGMVINPDGLVLTNNHVIENSTKITATLVSTGKTYQAKVVGYDETGDVSLIKLQNASGLKTIPLGNSSSVKTGDSVLAMGNAEGRSEIVSAAGQVTGLNQTITASDQGGTISQETLHGMIETNADIVSGDSGGPLANAAGNVIGMDTAGDSVSYNQQQSAGFAIPINTALAVARQIEAGQASSTIEIGYPPFIGVYIGKGNSANPQTQAQDEQNSGSGSFGGGGNFGGGGGGSFGGGGNGFGGGNGSGTSTGGSGSSGCYTSDADLSVPSTIAPVSSGTLVLGTICGSPAASAGMTAGSVITGLNGKAVGSPSSLGSLIAKYHPGDSVSVTWVSPSGQHKSGTLALTAGPPL
jgi:S1-C subfamily serine protease